MSAKLVLATGGHAGIAAPLKPGYFMIGRHRECQIRPKTHLVSRRHCLVHYHSDHLRVFDLGSANGSFINDRELEPNHWATLHDGDVLRCAAIEFRVCLDEPAPSAKEATPSPGPNAAAVVIDGAAWGDFDIAGFLEREDERERSTRTAESRRFQYDGHDDAHVLHGDEPGSPSPSSSNLVTGLVTGLDATGGDPEAPAVHDRARNSAVGVNDDHLTPRAQRIAKIRARIENERKTQASGPIQPAVATPNRRDEDRSRLSVCVVIALTILAVASFAFSVHHMLMPDQVRVLRGID